MTKELRKQAVTTYRCYRGCTLGYVVPHAGAKVLAWFDGHAWQLESDPTVPIPAQCRHLTGILRWSDADPANVNLSQEDVRTIAPGGQAMHHAEAMQIPPIPLEAWNRLMGKSDVDHKG